MTVAITPINPNVKRIGVAIQCLACHKDFTVKVDHPGKVLDTWRNNDRCPKYLQTNRKAK